LAGGEATVPDTRRALLGLRTALAFFAGGALIGGPWDMLYHMQTPFESFFSPPHLFIYGMTAAAVVIVVAIALKPALRSAFGESKPIPLLPWSAPGGLVFLGAGLVVLLLSGALDELWHGAFGVDETRFSVPHAMFGWGLLVTTLGFTSARLALRDAAPLGNLEAHFFAFLILSFSAYAFLLPFLVYPTRSTVRAISALPVITSQPGAAHTFRMYESWEVYRAGVGFMPLGATWAGFAVRALSILKPGSRFALLSAALSSALYGVLWFAFAARLGIQAEPGTWLPLPILAPAAVVALGKRFRRRDANTEWVAGASFGALTLAFWPPLGSSVLLFAVGFRFAVAMFAFRGGMGYGSVIARVVRRPEGRAPVAVVAVLGVAVPMLFGILDFAMRWTTP
jgi:hypothetical protein